MSEIHPDIRYLMKDDIGKVIAEGFSVLYRTQPHHPIDFFAKWLLNNCATNENKKLAEKEEETRQELIQKFEDNLKKLQSEQEKQKEEE
mmetsp:Transcript_35437/g.31935  ORF Transcript_35437/g.31935 Transcript_35437/m.31935 type:complete len:89 (-) Transcript_35437:1818-2084(-)